MTIPSKESFEVVPEHVADAGRYVQAVAQELVTGVRSADSEVMGLMSTWTGGAAAAYLEGWEETRRAAIQTLEALADMAELLGVVSETLTAADQINAGQFGSLNLPSPT